MAKNKGNGGSQAFAVAQQIGKSLFLPIAVLPPAGILLGIGSSFTNPTTIATYGLSGILHEGNILYMFFQLLNGAGNAVFGNLALIFEGKRCSSSIRGNLLSDHADDYERTAHHRRIHPGGRQPRPQRQGRRYRYGTWYPDPADGCVRRYPCRPSGGSYLQQVL